MSDLLTDDDLRTEREPVKEPSKRWVTHWRSKRPGFVIGRLYDVGDVYVSPRVFPSRDIADSAAAEQLTRPEMAAHWDYIGAHPGEAP